MRIRLLLVLALVAVTAASQIQAGPQAGPQEASSVKILPLSHTAHHLPIRSRTQAHREAAAAENRSAVQPRFSSNAPTARVAADQGNVAVLQDDGTLITPDNPFNLSNSSLVFTPSGSSYSVQSVTPTFINPGGNQPGLLALGGASATLPIGFNFPFYGTSYTTLYVNSSGNLTFGSADDSDVFYDIRTAISSQPRIAPLFDYMVDQYGGGSGQIAAERFTDHLNVYWLQVEDYNGEINTFEISMYNTGVIQFNYGAVGDPTVTGAVVALSPGNSTTFQQGNFAQQTASLAFTGSIGEVFSPYADLNLNAIGFAFYQSHPDNYDGYIAFADFDGLTIADGYPYAQQVRNTTQGLNTGGSNGLFDGGSYFGSASRLFITGNMGSVSDYPADPTAIFAGPHSTNTLVGQTFGHAWMSYVDTNPSSLLGLSGLWSFTMDGQGSVMEGNLLQNNGDGTFTTINADYQYSPLDQYLMGLIPPASVPNWYVVQNPLLISAPSTPACANSQFGAACYAEVGVKFGGTSQAVTIQNVTSNVGPRVPSAQTSQKSFNVAFIVVTPQGQSANPQNVAQVDGIRQSWQNWFSTATGGHGSVSTTLQALAPTISSISPNQGPTIGGSSITISGAHFQATSTVTIGGVAAAVSAASSTSLQVIVPANGAGTDPVVITNPDGQSASSSYTYSSNPVSQVQVGLAANGSTHIQSSGTAAQDQVGYGVITPGTGVAVIKSYSGGNLVSEAAIPPTAAATQWVMYGEYDGAGTGIRTGIAIANPGSTAASMTLTLNNGTQTTLQLAAGAQHAAFLDEFFPSLKSFLGTLTVQSNTPVSIVALRGTQNANGQFIISTIPLSSGSTSTGAFSALPIVADGGTAATGGTYATDIILVNPGTTTTSGTIGFSFTVQTDQGTNSQFAYTIPAGGMYRIRTAGAPSTVTSGYASVSVTAGSPTPNTTAIIRLSSGGNLISETAVPSQPTITNGMMFGSLETTLRTGIAMLNGNAQDAIVTLTPLDGSGHAVAAGVQITVPAYQHVSKFLDEMIPTLPVGYEGTVLVQSSEPVFAISLRGTTTINGFLMSTTPVLDTSQNYGGTYYFPQVVDGGGFATEFLMMNVGAPNVNLQFFDQTGKALALPLN